MYASFILDLEFFTMVNAIETPYKGILFRSRLEAKWAVFMDELNVIWEYEIDGFENDNGKRYLPDFYLPRLNCFVEIKPRKPTEDEYEKCWLAVEATGKDLFVLWGLPQDPWEISQDDRHGCFGMFRQNVAPQESEFYEEWIVSDDRYWAHCPSCNTVGIVLVGATEKLKCCSKNPGHSLAPEANGKIAQAAEKARNYRFGKIA